MGAAGFPVSSCLQVGVSIRNEAVGKSVHPLTSLSSDFLLIPASPKTCTCFVIILREEQNQVVLIH